MDGHVIIFTIYLSLFTTCRSFYVPGVAPVEFKEGDNVEVKAVKMTSSITQLPYDYYSLKLCVPRNGTLYKTENLGEILRGDRIVNTAYEVKMKESSMCKVMCDSIASPKHWSAVDSRDVIERIRHDYYVHLLVDNLPCATKFEMIDTGEQIYERGFKLGFIKDDTTYINNHLKLILSYHTENGEDFRVVRFEVEALSIDYSEYSGSESSCMFPDKRKFQSVMPNTDNNVLFTYGVEWRASNVRWASRWDIYLQMADVQIHWFSIVNSLVVVFFLSGILTMIMVRTLRRDIARYNADESLEETLEESGWKLVHGDVFRPPKYSKLFSALIGSGVQIFYMIFITIVLAMLGMLSPASRGALMTAGIFLYIFMSLIGGYMAGRLYRTLKGHQWKSAAFWTGTLYPAFTFGTCFFLNFFIWGKHSSGAVPFVTMLTLFSLWFCIALPLTFIGYYFGFRKQPYEHPVRTNQIPRQVPEQVWYMHPVFCLLMAGVLPFGAMFIELFFILSAIWENHFYYLFGFLFLVFLILVVSCAQISIVMVYFQLCGENYHWWWHSLITSGGSAVYVAAYSVFYLITKLEIYEFVSLLLYFGYTTVMVITFWLLTGTIGFYAAYIFIRKIYAAVKID